MKPVKQFSPDELFRKAQLDSIVRNGLTTFLDVGMALIEMQDSELYLVECATFEEYMAMKYGITRSRGYQLISAANIAQNVSTIVQLPTEAAARPLTRLDKKEQRKAARELKKMGGEVTAKAAEKAAKKIKPKPEPKKRNGSSVNLKNKKEAERIAEKLQSEPRGGLKPGKIERQQFDSASAWLADWWPKNRNGFLLDGINADPVIRRIQTELEKLGL